MWGFIHTLAQSLFTGLGATVLYRHMEYTGRCMKCRVNDRQIAEATVVTMTGKGGSERHAVRGKCAVCGTTMYKMLSKAAAEEIKKAA